MSDSLKWLRKAAEALGPVPTRPPKPGAIPPDPATAVAERAFPTTMRSLREKPTGSGAGATFWKSIAQLAAFARQDGGDGR